MLTSPIDNILVEKAKRRMLLRTRINKGIFKMIFAEDKKTSQSTDEQ